MLLLLHGALGDQTQFDALRPMLATAGRAPESHSAYLHTLDLAGHGARPLGHRPFRLESFAADVTDWLDAHDNAQRNAHTDASTDNAPAQRVDIFGYSMGGYVALLTAAAHPDRVRSVFTLGTKLDWSPAFAQSAGEQLDPATIRAKVPRFAEALAARHPASGWEQVVRNTREALLALGDAPLLTHDMLARITCPVRLAVGDRDTTVTLEEVRQAVQVLPNADFEVLPSTPHPFERVPMDRLAWSLTQFRASVAP